MRLDKYMRVEWSWLDRDGCRNSITFDLPSASDVALADARDSAMRMGYPGHAGGWWNYLVTDMQRLLKA